MRRIMQSIVGRNTKPSQPAPQRVASSPVSSSPAGVKAERPNSQLPHDYRAVFKTTNGPEVSIWGSGDTATASVEGLDGKGNRVSDKFTGISNIKHDPKTGDLTFHGGVGISGHDRGTIHYGTSNARMEDNRERAGGVPTSEMPKWSSHVKTGADGGWQAEWLNRR
jgi:hypothetical protein